MEPIRPFALTQNHGKQTPKTLYSQGKAHKANAQSIWSRHLSSLFFVYLVYKISLFPQHISHAPASVFLQWSPPQLLSIYLWIPLSCSQASLSSFSSLPHLFLLHSSSHNLIHYYYPSIYFHCFLDNSCHTGDRKLFTHLYNQTFSML